MAAAAGAVRGATGGARTPGVLEAPGAFAPERCVCPAGETGGDTASGWGGEDTTAPKGFAFAPDNVALDKPVSGAASNEEVAREAARLEAESVVAVAVFAVPEEAGGEVAGGSPMPSPPPVAASASFNSRP